jgi:putative restriction endonuclease
VRGFVANTDFEWFTFLRERRPDEVNFWQPSGGDAFRALQPGEPLFYRLKSPRNAIGGFGVFARHEVVPAWLAWESFGWKNGAPDFDSMCRRIEHYRRGQPQDPNRQYRIGCIMVAQPVFFEDADWVREPAAWPQNTVRGKGYALEAGEGRRIWRECLDRVQAGRVPLAAESAQQGLASSSAEAPRYGSPVLVKPRLGQGTFSLAVTQAYGGACAVSGEHSLPVLDAAHIRGFAQGGSHDVSNGLLLRTDIHRLFDRGYVTVTPEHRFLVSKRLEQEWENGRIYYAHHGEPIAVPGRTVDHPDPALLRWHNDHVFERMTAV